jgi:hypothetical protein
MVIFEAAISAGVGAEPDCDGSLWHVNPYCQLGGDVRTY